MAIKAPKLRVTGYMRNVGRSFGYAVGDVVGEYAPTIRDIAKDTKSAIDDAKMSSGDLRSSIRNMINDYKTGIVANTLDDLKSGNWYNKQREEDALNDMFGGGFDFDDDWGDFDADSSDDSDISPSDDTRDTKALINSIDSVGERISKNVAYSNARSAEYIVSNQKASTRAMYELTGKGFNQVSGILMNMSNTMVGIASLGGPLTQHIQNSSVFYTQTTETLNKVSSSLDKLVERTAFMDAMNKTTGGNKKKGLLDVFAGGDFSLSSYIDMVKENSKEQLELISGMKDMIEMFGGKGGKNTSLAQLIPKAIINVALPNFFKATLKQFSESINNALMSGMVRGSKATAKSSNPLINLIGRVLFGEAPKTKSGIDTSKYERGPMQWDGEAKKALTYVIPNYLAKIYASLSGDEKYFDYETGKYTSVSAIKKKRNDLVNSEVINAGGEFRTQARNLAKGNKNVKKQIDNFIRNAIMNDNGEFNFYELEKYSRGDKATYRQVLKEFGIDERTANVIIQTIRMANNPAFGNKYRNMASNFERDVYGAKGRISSRFSEAEARGNSSLGLLEDGWITEGSYMVSGGPGNGPGGRGKRVGGARITRRTNVRQPKIIENADGSFTVDNVTISQNDYYKWQNLQGKDKEEFLRKKKLEHTAKTAKEKGRNIINRVTGMDAPNTDMDTLEPGGAAGTASDQKSRFKRMMSSVKYYWQKPFAYVSMALDNLTRGINELFWGVDGNDGIIQKISDKIKSTWEGVQQKFKELFPDEKDKEKKSLKDAIKEEWGNAKNAIGTEIFGKAFGNAKTKLANVKQRAAEFDAQYADLVQQGLLDKFGKEAGTGSGLLAGGASGEYELIGNDIYTKDGKFYEKKIHKAGKDIGKEYFKELNFKGKFKVLNAKNAAKVSSAYGQQIKQTGAEVRDSIKNSKPVQSVAEGANILGHGLMDFFTEAVFGGKENLEDQKKTIFENLGKTMNDLAPAKGAIGLGAIGGVGVSLLTGALVGPIAGAAIGAGIGLATKSEAFQNFLFGEGDPESKEYHEGLLGGFGKALKADGFKSAKKIGTGTAIGAATGTLLGSPIVGAIVGGAAGYVSSSQKAQEMLFGTPDNKTWIGKAKDEIKKRFPNMTAGMIAGLVAGPFTLPGNLIFGATLGYMSTSDKFKNFMFGDPNDKNDKGLAGKIHDRIMNPLDSIMHNLANVTKTFTKRLFKSLGSTLSNWGKSALNAFKGTKAGKLAGKVDKGIRSAITGAVDVTGNILGMPNRALNKAALNMGADVYDANLGRNLTAAEKQERRNLLANGSVIEEDGKFYKVDPFSGKKKEISEKRYNRHKKLAEERGWKENGDQSNFEKIISQLSPYQLQSLDLSDTDSTVQSLIKMRSEEGSPLADMDDDMFAGALNRAFGKGGNGADQIKSNLAIYEKMAKKEQEDKQEFYDNQSELNKAIHERVTGGSNSIWAFVKGIAKRLGVKVEDIAEDAGNLAKDAKDKAIDKLKEGMGPAGEDDSTRELLGEFDHQPHFSETENKWVEGEGSGLRRRLRRFAGGASDEEETETSTDMFGNVHQYKVNSQGEKIEDTSDKETIKSRKIMDKFTESISSLPLIGSILGGFKGLGKLFGGSGEGEGGEKGEKKSIFGSLMEFLNPSSPNSGWFSLGQLLVNGKNKLLNIGANALGWAGLGTMAVGVGTIGTTIAAYTGKLNDIANKAVKAIDKDDNATSHGRLNSGSLTLTMADGSKKEVQVDPTTGNPVKDDDGNYIDYQGNPISPDDVTDYSFTENRSLQKNLIKNTALQTAKNVAKGAKGVKALGGVGPGAIRFGKKAVNAGKGMLKKAASKTGSKWNKIAVAGSRFADNARGAAYFAKKGANKVGEKVGELATKAASSGIGQKILSAIEAVGGALKKVLKKFKLDKFANKIDDLIASLAQSLTTKVTSLAGRAGKALAGFADAIPVIGQVMWVADLVVTATNAWGDAENILGIVEEANTGECIVATLIATINEAIPFVGGLIPHDMMASIVIGAMEAVGLFSDEIAALREKQAYAKQVVDQYNSENGTDYTIEEYNLNVNENVKSGWWTGTKHWAKSKWEGVKNTASKAWEGAKDMASNAWDTVTGWFGSGSGLIHKVPSHSLSSGFKRTKRFRSTMFSGGDSGMPDATTGSFSGTGKIQHPFQQILGSVFDNFDTSNILSGIGLNKEDMKSFTDQIKKMTGVAEEGDLAAVSDKELKLSSTMQKSPLAKFFSIGFDMAKSFNTMGGVFQNILKPVSDITGETTEESTSIGDKLKDVAKSTWDNVKSAVSSFWSGLFGSSDESTTTETSDQAGGASGFVSQFDPRYQNYRVSGTSFANKGCGPAVAAMTASALGKNLSVGSAVNASQGYQVGNGVTLDYFQQALGSQGIDTQYIAGGGAGDLYNSIAAGKKVILLGQDASNTSKAYSPFGPRNHYVVATGLDRAGNVVVNDPELNGPTTYNPGILNSVKYGVAAGRSGIRRRPKLRIPRSMAKVFRRLAGGGTPRDDEITRGIWAYLRNLCGMSEAAAAGIMGNMEAESGCDPTKHQVSGSAYGLCQWDGGRRDALMQLPNYDNLRVQLDYFKSELPSQYWNKSGTITDIDGSTYSYSAMSLDDFKNLTDVRTATIKFEAAFERAGKPRLANRITYAETYYEMFKGRRYSNPVSPDDDTYSSMSEHVYHPDTESNPVDVDKIADQTQTQTQSDQTEEKEDKYKPSSLFGVLGSISSIFSDAFSGALNKTSTQTEDSENLPDGNQAGSVVGNAASTVASSATSAVNDALANVNAKITQIPGGKAQEHPQGQKNAQSVVDIARSQLGVTEAGDNITDYGKFTGTDGQPWCAAFTSWVFDKAFAGDMAARNKALHGGISASVGTLLNQFDKDHAVKDTPQPGDLVLYKNGTSHVGIVEGVDGNTVYTIEGNTSGDSSFDRNGGVVYRKSFDYTNRTSGKGAKLTGFGRPDWSAAASGSGLLDYTQLANKAGGSSGVLMRSRAGSRNGVPSVVDPKTGRIVPFSRFAGGATNLADASKAMLNQVATSNNNRGNGISPELVTQLLSAITAILNNIADNTAPVNKIYQALVAYLESGGSSGTKTETVKVNKSKKAVNGGDGEIDPKLKSLAATLAQLAKG